MNARAPGDGPGRRGRASSRLLPVLRAAVAAGCLLAGGLTGAGASQGRRGETAAPRFYVGGIQVHETDHARWTGTLRRIGMNTVAVTVYARQGRWDGDDLTFNDREDAVVDEIRAARREGLAVVLVLRVALDHAHAENKFLWHGMILPASDGAIQSWFERYGAFVAKWARVAEAEGVELLAVGSELNALTATRPVTRVGHLRDYYGYYWYQHLSRARALRFADELEGRRLWVRGFDDYDSLERYLDDRFEATVGWARRAYLRAEPGALSRINARRRVIDEAWVRLIGRVRQVYRGRLTYAANFDSYRDVGFWRHLDLIGINAYFSLRGEADGEPGAERQLALYTRSWERILAEVEAFERERGLDGMPYLFTEIGYTFRRHSTVEPWAHAGFSVVGWGGQKRRLVIWNEQPIDYEERNLALLALQRARRSAGPGLRGLLYWKLSTDAAHERIEPFVIHVGVDSTDPAQATLVRFLRD